MFRTTLAPLHLAMSMFAIVVSACGLSEAEESATIDFSDAPADSALMARDAAVEVTAAQALQPMPAPAPTAVPAPAQAPATPAAPAPAQPQSAEAKESSQRPVASLVAQQRIIVRTVDMGIVVEDVTAAIEAAARHRPRHGRLARRLRAQPQAPGQRLDSRCPPALSTKRSTG